MEQLKQECNACRKCPLHKTRTNVVFGRGNEHARLLFVGEAPGAKEDEQGAPFVGASGKLLEKVLSQVGFCADDYYIANILKCRPPENRDPSKEEIALCTPYLQRQIAHLSPCLVVCLGRIAASHLISRDFRITSSHGKVFEKDGVSYTAVYHPAAVLRDPRKRADFVCDLADIYKCLENL